VLKEDRCNIVKNNDVLYQDLPSKDRKKQISDHLPLWAEFKINELTQQLTQIINP
jgi:endonuclease/exonuclease/phosphatase family metal-dependent hydrolase